MGTKKKNIKTSCHSALGDPKPLPLLLLLLVTTILISTLLECYKRLQPNFLISSDVLGQQSQIFLLPDSPHQAETRKSTCPPLRQWPKNTSQEQNPDLDMETSPRGPYHNWDLFQADFQQMLTTLKIYAYPDIHTNNSSFAGVFLPHSNPYNPKLGNYFSEHMFKINLVRSDFLTPNQEEAHFFFLPFSINSLRNDPRVHSEASIAQFVADYSKNVSESFGFWNSSQGADHFYVCCHSVGRDAASKFLDLHRNAIQVVCSSSYYQKYFVSHKDISLPQIWPRMPETGLVPPNERTTLAFFAGRGKNSRIRQQVIRIWENDTSMDISGNYHKSYQEGFRKSKYCLHVKGYEVNTARISDAIHFGCVPVIISDHYDLPFANVLDWSKFSVVVSHGDVPHLKEILLSISEKMYGSFLANLHNVRRHFQWHESPQDYDSFLMTVYQLWLRRGIRFSSFS